MVGLVRPGRYECQTQAGLTEARAGLCDSRTLPYQWSQEDVSFRTSVSRYRCYGEATLDIFYSRFLKSNPRYSFLKERVKSLDHPHRSWVKTCLQLLVAIFCVSAD
ncbi:hypothetical protein J6590_022283 [Homalodisca vitripennis]|nr:hypothetical protein J6590_022283 [Homalodisca vitripennis]